MKQCYQQIIAAKEQQMLTWQMVPRVTLEESSPSSFTDGPGKMKVSLQPQTKIQRMMSLPPAPQPQTQTQRMKLPLASLHSEPLSMYLSNNECKH